MRRWSPKETVSAIAMCVLVVVAGCTIEVNINTDPDSEPVNPIVTVAPDAPVVPNAPAASEEPAGADAPLPPAPPAAPRPTAPPTPTAEPGTDEAVRDALFRFRRDEGSVEVPAPNSEDLSKEPTFTPFTQAPSIRNRTEVVAAMEAQYPPLLRDAGIGGTVRVFFFIDADGTTQSIRLSQSSGHPALDDAAMKVASVYRFSPALNREVAVPVWVQFPITFQTRR
jgi:protein TonB